MKVADLIVDSGETVVKLGKIFLMNDFLNGTVFYLITRFLKTGVLTRNTEKIESRKKSDCILYTLQENSFGFTEPLLRGTRKN